MARGDHAVCPRRKVKAIKIHNVTVGLSYRGSADVYTPVVVPCKNYTVRCIARFRRLCVRHQILSAPRHLHLVQPRNRPHILRRRVARASLSRLPGGFNSQWIPRHRIALHRIPGLLQRRTERVDDLLATPRLSAHGVIVGGDGGDCVACGLGVGGRAHLRQCVVNLRHGVAQRIAAVRTDDRHLACVLRRGVGQSRARLARGDAVYDLAVLNRDRGVAAGRERLGLCADAGERLRSVLRRLRRLLGRLRMSLRRGGGASGLFGGSLRIACGGLRVLRGRLRIIGVALRILCAVRCSDGAGRRALCAAGCRVARRFRRALGGLCGVARGLCGALCRLCCVLRSLRCGGAGGTVARVFT